MSLVRFETGAPGAVIATERLDDNDVLIVERNANGTVVAYTLPHFDLEETPAERVERLQAELKDAKKALKEASV